MAHIHLAWELGGGLGHIGRIRMLAQALLSRGHRVSVSVRDLAAAHGLLAGVHLPVLQAPVWQHPVVGLVPGQGNLAEVLFRHGYLDKTALGSLLAGWRAMLQQLQPDLLVADYAPTALLAARSLGLRSASIGSGFYNPPAGQPLPPLRDWDPLPAERLAASEAHLLRTANAALAEAVHAAEAVAGATAAGSAGGAALAAAARPQAVAPLRHAADLFLGDLPLLCSWPELDHYARPQDAVARWFGPNFMPHAGIAPQWPAGAGPRVFAYLKSSHPAHVAVLQALAEEGCSTLAYLPDVAGGAPVPFKHALIHYAAGPVALGQALHEAELCVCHAGEATLAQSLLAGVPLLMLPQHTEQFLLARRIARAGAGHNAALLRADDDWRAVVRRLLHEPAHRLAARAFAARYQDFDQQAMNAELAALLERAASQQ